MMMRRSSSHHRFSLPLALPLAFVLALALVVALALAPLAHAQNTSITFTKLVGAQPFPLGQSSASVVMGTAIYAYGGLVSGTAPSALIVSRDGAMTWSTIATLEAVIAPSLALASPSWTGGGINPSVLATYGRPVGTCNPSSDSASFFYVNATTGAVVNRTPSSSQRRCGATSILWRPKYSSSAGVTLLIGGTQCNVGFFNDVWLLDSTSITSYGNAPFSQRSGAGITTLQKDSIVLIAGGTNSVNHPNDVWMGFEVPGSVAPSWVQVGVLPVGREYDLASTSDNVVYAFGGGGSDKSTDIYRSVDAGASWVTLQAVGTSFSARTGAVLVAVGQTLYVMGGYDGVSVYLNDVWVAQV